jgi:hypothetical protein
LKQPTRPSAGTSPGGAPQVRLYEVAQTAACKKQSQIEIELAETSPTTLAGILAVMRYERDMRAAGDDLFTDDEGGAADPRHERGNWLATIEQSLTLIAGAVS